MVVLFLFLFFLQSRSFVKVLLNQFAQPFGSVGGKPVTQRRYMVTIAGEMLGKFWARGWKECSDERWGKSCSSLLRGS